MREWLAYPGAQLALRIVAALLGSLVFWWLVGRASRSLAWLSAHAQRLISARARRLGLRHMEGVSEHAVETLLGTAAGLLRIVLVAVLFYSWLLLLAYVLDERHAYVGVILDPLLKSVQAAGHALTDFLPNIVVLVLIVAVGRVLQSIIRAFVRGIATGRVTVLGLDSAVATPTHRILSFVLWIGMIIIAAPYLPGSDSKAFQAVSVMLGILVSLGSSSFVSNLIAGLALTYSRAYRVGDRVKIGEHYGDIVALGAITTRIRTIKDEELILPNGFAHGAAITNYSRYAKSPGVQVHTQVTIGYDAPYAIVEALLIRAALATPGVAAEPLPYVLQPALEDYYVRYEVCAYTQLPNELHLIEANLHRRILDTFFEAGVEICSPAVTSIRDGNAIAMPREAVRAALNDPRVHPDRRADLVDSIERSFRMRPDPPPQAEHLAHPGAAAPTAPPAAES